MSFAYWLPLVVVVFGNLFYHITAKSVPGDLNPFFSASVSYIIATIVCLTTFFLTGKDTTLSAEIHKVNWATLVMGIAIIMMEAGNIYVYRAGWNINTASIVAQGIVSIGLVLIGYWFFTEAMTVNKVVGLCVCLLGLYIINK